MRLTALHPDPRRGTGLVPTAVEVERGLPVSRLRPELVRLTGWAGWTSGSVRLAVDDALLDDTHRVGSYPLVPGCGLRPGVGPRPEAESAVDAALHVAVVAGPDCGRLVPAVPDAVATVRGAHPVGPPAVGGTDLVLADPTLRGVRVRSARGRVRVRADEAATLVRAVPRWWQRRDGRPVRVRRHRWVRWRADDELRVGATTLALRRRSGPSPVMPVRRTPRPLSRPLRAGAGDVRPGHARTAALMVVGPLVGSVALAVALRQPLLLLTAVSGPLVMLATGLGGHRDDDPTSSSSTTEARDPAHLVASTVLALDGRDALHRDAPWDGDGALAVVGPRGIALAVARGILLGELGTHVRSSVAVLTRDPSAWSWAAPVARTDGDGRAAHAERHVVVVDLARVTDETAALRSSSGPGERLLLVLPSRHEVPAWCRHVLEVGPTSARLRGTPGGSHPARDADPDEAGWRPVPLHAVSATTARAQVARACAVREVAAREAGPGAAGGRPADDLPTRVPLGGLPGVPDADPGAVAAAWDSPPPGLTAVLGRTVGLAPVEVDLVADGPHALVAGTTGAGKSELLTTWVLAAALRHPPDRLAVLLVDFKGGAGLGAVADLPHVVDHVTDLDEPRARRVLTGLRAELRRRERALAVRAARDLADLDPDDAATPPRLLVVVDELRALVDDIPDAAQALVRLAAQGRALGVHLVLATQRPAGAVTADLRANTTLRIALRVADPADSLDVVEVPDAALLPASAPGRAVLRRASGAPERIQVARPGGRVDGGEVTLAAPWPPAMPAPLPSGSSALLPGAPGSWTPEVPTRTASDHTAVWVRAARQAAVGRPARRVPWLSALPDRVTVDDVDPGPGLALAVADVPDEQRRSPVRWDPAEGHLLVLGGPGSGRSTALVTVGVEALRHGLPVHAVGLSRAAVDELRAHDADGLLGTVARPDETVRVARLAELLGARSPAGDGRRQPRAVLLLDGLAEALDALGDLARGAGADRLAGLWRSTGAVAVAASADVTGTAARHSAHFRDRLVLRVADASLDAVAGVPTALAGPRRSPGRAVHVGPQGAVLCQVALAGPARTTGAPPTRPSAPPRSAPGRPVPVRVEALPRHAARPAGLRASVGRVPLGVGGDDASPLHLDVGPGLLVAGPPGSGRSTALAVVADGLVRAGEHVVRLVDPAHGPVPPLPGVVDVDVGARLHATVGPPDGAVGDLLGGTLGGQTGGTSAGSTSASGAVRRCCTVLVDDLDEVERAHPELVDAWARWSGPACRFVAATSSSGAAGAFRGLAASLLRVRRAVVLDVLDPASAELVGSRAAWLADPADRPVGRGAVVVGRTVTPLQVYALDLEGSTAGPGPSS